MIGVAGRIDSYRFQQRRLLARIGHVANQRGGLFQLSLLHAQQPQIVQGIEVIANRLELRLVHLLGAKKVPLAME
jgi:hypothetical protein